MVTVGVLTGRFKKRALALAAFDAFAAALLTQLTQSAPPGAEGRGHGPG